MNYLLHLAVLLGLILFQTVLKPWLGCCRGLFDLLLVQVVFLGLFRSWREGLPLLLAAGLAMDGLSGSIFGLYTTAYLWVWLSMRLLIRLLRVNSPGVLLLVVFAAALLQAAVFLGGGLLAVADTGRGGASTGLVLGQLLWALLGGGPLLILLIRVQRRLERWTRRWLARIHAAA